MARDLRAAVTFSFAHLGDTTGIQASFAKMHDHLRSDETLELYFKVSTGAPISSRDDKDSRRIAQAGDCPQATSCVTDHP